MSALRIARQRAVTWARERAGRDGMSTREAARWAACEDPADLAGLIVAWLDGRVAQNPDHEGPPDPETMPLRAVLAAVNRAGFLTDSSQRAGCQQWRNAWVAGFVFSRPVLGRLEAALARAGLELEACRQEDSCDPGCPRTEVARFWAQACPLAADWIDGAWWVYAEDPEPGRNDRLWPALAAFARSERQLAAYTTQARYFYHGTGD
jgi:hypothetical protein